MRRKPPPQSVTTARRSPQEDRRRRTIQYLVAMGFRLVCFPLSIWAILSGWTVIGWVMAGIAIVAPSIAVGLANNVDHRSTSVPPPHRGQLPPAEQDR